MINNFKYKFLLLVFFIFSPLATEAVFISEINYDLDGTDTGREWIEIYNDEGANADLSLWKFNEAETNHTLNDTGSGFNLSANGFAVITDNVEKFRTDNPSFLGLLLDSSFSLSNTGEKLEIRDGNGNVKDSVTYSSDWGGLGDGNSLQKDSGVWKSGLPTPGEVFSGVFATDSSSNSNNNSQSSSNSSNSSSQTSVNQENKYDSPKIFAFAGEDKKAVAGGIVFFSGRAEGLEKKPLINGRFMWNFGDGVSVEGPNVSHTYHVPGNYVTLLSVSSGEWSATDRVEVSVFDSAFSIKRVVSGDKGFIEINNSANFEADISDWMISDGKKYFRFPSGTSILASKSVPFTNSVTNLNPDNSLSISLLYPNGELADKYEGKTSLVVSDLIDLKVQNDNTKVISSVKTERTILAEKVLAEDPEPEGQGKVVLSAASSESFLFGKSSLWIMALSAIIILGLLVLLSVKLSPKIKNRSRKGNEEDIEDGKKGEDTYENRELSGDDFKIIEEKDK